jgi:hypothetical protein
MMISHTKINDSVDFHALLAPGNNSFSLFINTLRNVAAVFSKAAAVESAFLFIFKKASNNFFYANLIMLTLQS